MYAWTSADFNNIEPTCQKTDNQTDNDDEQNSCGAVPHVGQRIEILEYISV